MLVAKEELLTILRAERRPDISLRFPFQRLPPELRNAIYRLHLVHEDGISPNTLDDSLNARAQAALCNKLADPDYMPPLFEYPALSLLEVCCQIHDEAIGIFYHYNAFQLQSVAALKDFLSTIGPRRRAFIREIGLTYKGKGCPAAFKLLATCENLQKIVLRVSDNTLSHCMHGLNLSCAHGVSHLLKIRGLETVEVYDLSNLQSEQTRGFEEALRKALRRWRKAIKEEKPAAKRKQASKDKNVAAGKKHAVEDGKAPRAKNTKLVHDGTQIVT